jgi:hypothetical protein
MGRLFDSKQFRTDLQLSGSFSGSFTGDGSSLTNVPATGIVGLNLSQIGSGSATASISPNTGLHVNTSISASIISGSILVIAPTGSFNHIITDNDTIEFRNRSTGVQTGRLKFSPETGLNVEDSAGARTRIRAGIGKFLQLEAFSNLNSIGPLTASIISASSTIFANDIEAFRMNVTHLTSSFITASTIKTSGSNIFGDEASDTHTFVGDIIAQNNISSSGYISASNFIGDGSQLSGVDSIYTANGNILETRTINDRDGGFTGTAGSNAIKMNVRNSGAFLVAGYQNNGDPGTTNNVIRWGPGTTVGGMDVRGNLGITSGGGRIDLTNSGGSQYFTVAQSGITSLVSLSATNITGSNISASGIFTGDGSGLINIPATGITGLNLSRIASGSATASIAPDKGLIVNTNSEFSGSLTMSGSILIPNSGSNITIDSGSLNVKSSVANANIATFTPVNSAGRVEINDAEVRVTETQYGYTGARLYSSLNRTGEFSLHYWASNTGVYFNGNANEGGTSWQQNFIGGGLHVGSLKSATANSVPFAFSVKGPSQLSGSLLVSSSLDVIGDAQITGSIETTGNILLHGGTLSIKNQGAQSEARFYCEVNNAHYTALKSQPHALFSGNPITLLPAYDLDFAKPNFQANITASGNISASGFYYGDGSQLTGISTTPFPFSGDAVITGSLTVSGSTVDFTSASAVNLNIEQIPLVNPIVEYVNCGAITSSGTTVPLPNNLTFVSSSVYEYIEIFINGLRMRYDMDFMPASTSTIKYFVTIPSGSEITYKSLKRP